MIARQSMNGRRMISVSQQDKRFGDYDMLDRLKAAEGQIVELVEPAFRSQIHQIFRQACRARRLDSRRLLVALDEIELDQERTEQVYDILETLGIQILTPQTWASTQEESTAYDPWLPDSGDLSEEDREKRAQATDDSYMNPSNNIQMYLHEIRRYRLLNMDEEVSLCHTIEKGNMAMDELKDLRLDGIFFGSEVDALLEVINKGRDAKDDLVKANLRLVVAIAKHFSCPGLQFLDLVQEGNLGLMKAADHYDYKLGFKFASYASWWVRESILRAISSSRIIRIPSHMIAAINKVAKASRTLVMDLGREPTPEEIADVVDMTPAQVVNVLQIGKDPISLDLPVGEDGESSVGDLIEDDQSMLPEDLVIAAGLRDHVDEALLSLSLREEEILRCRYGIDSELITSYEEIGDSLNMKGSQVRQVEARALRKLREPERCRKLIGYL